MLLWINGQGCKNDDEEQGGGIGLAIPILITFQIYKIKEGQLQDLMTLKMRRPTLVNLRIHMVDKKEEDSGNQTTEETTNTN